MKRFVTVSIVLAAACAAPPAPDVVEQRLLEADRAFLRATIDDGLDGWMSYFTDDAVRIDLHGRTHSGLRAIREADAPLFEPGGLRLRWEPREAVSFGDARGGLTRGRYTLIREAAEGGEPEVVDRGAYVTLWRLENGRFKVYFDAGAADPDTGGLID